MEDIFECVDECLRDTRPSHIFNSNSAKGAESLTVKDTKRIHTIISKLLLSLNGKFAIQPSTTIDQLLYCRQSSLKHFHMFRALKNLRKAMRKIFPRDLKDLVSDLNARLISAGTDVKSERLIKLIGGLLVKQLIHSLEVQERCILTTEAALDYLELEHWQSFSMVIIALVSDINTALKIATKELFTLYQNISDLLNLVDRRFPLNLLDFEHFNKLLHEENQKKQSDNLGRILAISHDQVKESKVYDALNKTKAEFALKKAQFESGSFVERDEFNDVTQVEKEGKNREIESSFTETNQNEDMDAVWSELDDDPIELKKKKKNLNSMKKKKKVSTQSNNEEDDLLIPNFVQKKKKKDASGEQLHANTVVKPEKLKKKRKVEVPNPSASAPVDFNELTPVNKKKKLNLNDVSILDSQKTPKFSKIKLVPLCQSTPLPTMKVATTPLPTPISGKKKKNKNKFKK